MNILITGGASGLGEVITKTLAQTQINHVYFTFANSVKQAKTIEESTSNASSIQCDFTKSEDVDKLIEAIPEMKLDVLINNAYHGKAIHTHFHKIRQDDFSNDFLHCIVPTVRITQAVLKGFRKQKQGKIITVLTSFLINTPPIGASCYVANKAYLQSMVKSWANEYAKYNVTSNAVAPSFMQTGLTSNVDERMIEQMKAIHPLKRLLSLDEVAQTIDFLSQASPHINGETIVLNSGVNIR